MSRVQMRKEERRRRRGDVLVAVAAVVLGAAFAWIVLSIQGLSVDLHTTRDDLQSTKTDLRQSRELGDALARQVQRLGGTPVAEQTFQWIPPAISVFRSTAFVTVAASLSCLPQALLQ